MSVGGGPAPEDLQERFAVWHDLVQGEEGVTIDGHGVSLHTEVAAQLHVEAHLHAHAHTCSATRHRHPLHSPERQHCLRK